MSNLPDLLNKLAGTLPNQFDLLKKPDTIKCHSCERDMIWLWIESECPDMFRSRWITNVCICVTIKFIIDKLNASLTVLDKVNRDIDDNSHTKKYSKREMGGLNYSVDGIKSNIRRLQNLLIELRKIKTNDEFLNKRFKLAKDYDAWQELLDCTESEAKFYIDVMELEKKEVANRGVYLGK